MAPMGKARCGDRDKASLLLDSGPSEGWVSPTGLPCPCSEYLNSRARHGVPEMVPEAVEQGCHQHQSRTQT